jgi:hypothetical protein
LRLGAWTTPVIVSILLGFAGYWLLFSTFMVYDDEGYILLSLRNFFLHGELYDKVYTQYGPIPYLWYGTLHQLFGLPFDNVGGRWITLLNWFLTCAACAGLVGRVTRSAIWTTFTFAGTFTQLWVMTSEPIHPGGLICCIIATAVLLGSEALRSRRLVGFAAITAAASAALLLTKINVGIFFLGAVVSWLVVNSAPSSRARLATWIVAGGCVLLPFALMQALIHERWVQQFALVFAIAALGTLFTGKLIADPTVGLRVGTIFALVLAVAIALPIIVILSCGTSLQGLVEGIIRGPLRHPGVYFFPMRWSAGTILTSFGSLACCIGVIRNWESAKVRLGVAWARFLVVAIFLSTPLQLIPVSMAAWTMSYGLSLAWIFVLPVSDKPSASIRFWLGLVLIFQSLHVYPIAGSQVNWATFLWIPLIALGLHDALPSLCASVNRFSGWFRGTTLTVILVIVVFMSGNLLRIGWSGYHRNPRLGLAGAESLRLSNDLTYTLRTINENLRAHASLLFSFPGLYSANLWTELSTPTLSNATHWFSLLSAGRQEEIIERLAQSPEAAMLVQRDLLDYLARSGFRTDGPLHDWVMQHFEKSVSFGGYEIWVRRGRSIAAFSTARPEAGPHGVLQTLTLTLQSTKMPVSRIDLCNIDQPDSPLISFGPENAHVSITKCGMDGRLSPDQTSRTGFPFSSTGPALVRLSFSPIQVSSSFSRLLLVLRDSSGNAVKELLVLE